MENPGNKSRASTTPNAQPAGSLETSLLVERFEDIDSKAIKWLWQDRIPKGKLTIFGGNPDCGKTTVLIDIIARITTGRRFGDGSSANEPCDVLMLIAEDDPADTIKPRLIAAEADVHRVSFLRGVEIRKGAKKHERMLALDRDLTILEEHLKLNPDIALVSIDPLSSYLGRADLNREQGLREVLVPIKELGERTGTTIIGLGHFNKRADVGALHKLGGAVALAGVSRAVWLFAKNPEADGEYLMLLGKGNLTRRRSGLKYRIEEKQLPTGGAPYIIWGNEHNGDADTILAVSNDPEEKREAKARKFLQDYLGAGAKPAKDVFEAAEQEGIKERTLREAKSRLGVKTDRRNGHWWWYLQHKDEDESPF